MHTRLVFMIFLSGFITRFDCSTRCYQCNNCVEPFSKYNDKVTIQTCAPNQYCMVSKAN